MMKLFGTICAVAILSCAAAYGQKPPVMPVSPEQLVKVMPGTLKGWVIAEATAQNRFMKWIQTRATRVYQRRKGEAKARITITDTGRYPSSLVRFRDFKPGKANGVEKKMIRGNPALVRDIPERGKQVQILVHDRFIVELLVPPNYEEDMKRWIRSIDLRALSRLRGRRVRELPKTYTMVSINELQPSKNREYSMSITTHAEVEAILRQMDEYEDEIAEGEKDEE